MSILLYCSDRDFDIYINHIGIIRDEISISLSYL